MTSTSAAFTSVSFSPALLCLVCTLHPGWVGPLPGLLSSDPPHSCSSFMVSLLHPPSALKERFIHPSLPNCWEALVVTAQSHFEYMLLVMIQWILIIPSPGLVLCLPPRFVSIGSVHRGSLLYFPLLRKLPSLADEVTSTSFRFFCLILGFNSSKLLNV